MTTSVKAAVRLIQEDQRRFGELDLLAKLGHGGMADVYLASMRSKPAELVVLKRLKEDLLDPEHRSMFEDEARIMPRLSHPNVVRTFEVGSQEGWPYLSMEFLDGLPLDQCWEALADLGESAVKHIVCELLEGLHYAHELRSTEGQPLDLVHRDVSPQNVFVTYDGRVTLVDFGIAKSRGRAQHTSTGVVRGKLAYMAPEQALCEAVDRRADVFAAGVILFELATGERYWGNFSDVQILKHMTFGDLPKFDPAAHASRFAAGTEHGNALALILAKALAARPEDRFGSAREFRDALRDIRTAEVRRMELGAAVAGASRGYREALRAVVDEHLITARGTQGLVGVDPLAESGERMTSRPDMEEQPAPSSGQHRRSSAERVDELAGAPSTERGSGPVSETRSLGTATDTARSSDVLAESVETTTHHGLAADRVQRVPAAERRLRGLLLAGAVLVALMAAAFFLGGQKTREPERAARTSEPAQPTPTAHSQIEVKLGATKASTIVFIDNAPVGDLPFTGRFPRDGAAHTLRAEAPGFQSESRIVVFDRDVDIVFSLQPARTDLEARSTAVATTNGSAAVSSPGGPRRDPPPTSTNPRVNPTGGFDYSTRPWGKGPKK